MTTPIKGPDPYADKELWTAAKTKLKDGVTLEEWVELTELAAKDGSIDANDRALLSSLAHDDNASALLAYAEGKSKAPTLKALPPDVQAKMDAVYDTFETEGAIAAYEGQTMPTVTILAEEMWAARLGNVYDLDVDSEQFLDEFGQFMLPDLQGFEREKACVPTSTVALAVHAGPEGVMGLCQAMLDQSAMMPKPYGMKCPKAEALLERLQSGDTSVTMQEMAELTTELYRLLSRCDVYNSGNPMSGNGIDLDTISQFLHDHKQALAPLFADGSRLLALDTDGQDGINHAAAKFGDGKRFEPWERVDGHHLLENDLETNPYAGLKPQELGG